MTDIDRNINSFLYETNDSISKKININTHVRNNSNVIYSANVSATNGGNIVVPSVTLEPGEYYYRHTFYPVESNNDIFCFFCIQSI